MNEDLILYGTVGCHLCEQARTVIELADATAKHVDIIDDEALYEQYGMRIPVLLREDTKTELGWPFNKVDVLQFLS